MQQLIKHLIWSFLWKYIAVNYFRKNSITDVWQDSEYFSKMSCLDNHYYLANQVHPVVSRLCDPVEETDSAFIASCLGKDEKVIIP